MTSACSPRMSAKQGAQRGQSEADPPLLRRICRSSAPAVARTSRSTTWRDALVAKLGALASAGDPPCLRVRAGVVGDVRIARRMQRRHARANVDACSPERKPGCGLPVWRRSGSARRLLPRASAWPAAASTGSSRSCAWSPLRSRMDATRGDERDRRRDAWFPLNAGKSAPGA